MARQAQNKITTLFTSAGRRVELIRAFRRAYKTLNLSGNIIALDVDPLAPTLQVADQPYVVPRIDDPQYIPTLVDICQTESVDLIFPLIDPDIPCLATHKKIISATGAKVAVVSQEAVAKTIDKWHTTQFFRRIGLSTPQSWLPGHLDSRQADFPLFIKPRRGSASKFTFKVHNQRELEFFLDYVPDPIIQECLPGPEITNDVICDLEGKILGISSRQRIEVRWGEMAKGITIYDPVITKACEKIAKTLPAIGPITVQCMMKDRVPYFTEINARVGGGLPLGIAAGVDAPLWLLAGSTGIHVDIPPLGDYHTGLVMTRCDDSFFLSAEDRNVIHTKHFPRAHS